MLDLSKLESEYVTLNKRPIDLIAMIDYTLMQMKPLAMKKSISFAKDYEADKVSPLDDGAKFNR